MSSDMNLQIGSKVHIRSGSGNDPIADVINSFVIGYGSKEKKITNSGNRLPDIMPTSSAVSPINNKRVVDKEFISVTVNDKTIEPSGDVSADSKWKNSKPSLQAMLA